MTYPSKVDAWLGVILALLALLAPVQLFMGFLALRSSSASEVVPYFLSAGMIVLVFGLLVWPVRYTLGEHDLMIRFGVIRVRIAYQDIQEVTPSRALWSSPALSLDRLAIHYRGGFALISPVRKEQFLQELAKHDTGFLLTGGRIQRR